MTWGEKAWWTLWFASLLCLAWYGGRLALMHRAAKDLGGRSFYDLPDLLMRARASRDQIAALRLTLMNFINAGDLKEGNACWFDNCGCLMSNKNRHHVMCEAARHLLKETAP